MIMNAIYFYNGYFLFFINVYLTIVFLYWFPISCNFIMYKVHKIFNLDNLLNLYAYSCLRETGYRYRCTH